LGPMVVGYVIVNFNCTIRVVKIMGEEVFFS